MRKVWLMTKMGNPKQAKLCLYSYLYFLFVYVFVFVSVEVHRINERCGLWLRWGTPSKPGSHFPGPASLSLFWFQVFQVLDDPLTQSLTTLTTLTQSLTTLTVFVKYFCSLPRPGKVAALLIPSIPSMTQSMTTVLAKLFYVGTGPLLIPSIPVELCIHRPSSDSKYFWWALYVWRSLTTVFAKYSNANIQHFWFQVFPYFW